MYVNIYTYTYTYTFTYIFTDIDIYIDIDIDIEMDLRFFFFLTSRTAADETPCLFAGAMARNTEWHDSDTEECGG